jgi:hypothetical protein
MLQNVYKIIKSYQNIVNNPNFQTQFCANVRTMILPVHFGCDRNTQGLKGMA